MRVASSLPIALTHPQQISGILKNAHTNGSGCLFGAGPVHGEGAISICRRLFLVFDAAESGADSTNYTQGEFRIGTIADYDVIGQVRTKDGSAGTVFATDVYHRLEPGKAIWVAFSRVGNANNFSGSSSCFGMDISGERIA